MKPFTPHIQIEKSSKPRHTIIWAWLGSYEEAVKNYNQTLKRRPNWPRAGGYTPY